MPACDFLECSLCQSVAQAGRQQELRAIIGFGVTGHKSAGCWAIGRDVNSLTKPHSPGVPSSVNEDFGAEREGE
jgi:hypothetical protein